MEDSIQRQLTLVMLGSGLDEELIDDDLLILLDELSLNMAKLKLLLVSKGMYEEDATIMVKRISNIISCQDSDEDLV